jgi:hypothetical protein
MDWKGKDYLEDITLYEEVIQMILKKVIRVRDQMSWLSIGDGTDTLSQNVDKKLPLHNA